MAAEPTIIVGIAKTKTGYVVLDQLQREHHAADIVSLGGLIAALCTDEDIPKAERIKPNAEKLREVGIKVVRKIVPNYGEAAEPIVDGVTIIAKLLHARITAPSPPKMRGPRPSRTAAPAPSQAKSRQGPKITVRQEDR